MGSLCDKVVGMFQEEFLPGLLYQVRVLAKCLCVAWLEGFVPRWDLSLLGARGTFQSHLRCGSAQRHALHGEGCHLLGLGDCLGTDMGRAAEAGCSSTGEALCDRANG